MFDMLFYNLTCLCYDFYGLSALFGCWSSVFIRRIIYKCLHVCPFDNKAFAVSWKVGIPETDLTTPVWVAVVTPPDRPKSVCNRCLIEVLVAFLCCHVAFGFFCG